MSGTARVTAQNHTHKEYNKMFVITSNPVHDADMYDIELASQEMDTSKYPVCDICGEHIVPGEQYGEPTEDIYIHRKCMKYVRWRVMDARLL